MVLPAMVSDTSLRLGHCCNSRMRAFTRATVVPKMNTSSVLDWTRFIVRIQDGPVTSELRVLCPVTYLCVVGTQVARVKTLVFINRTVIGRCIGQATDITMKHTTNNAGNSPQNRLLQTCALVCIRNNSIYVWRKILPAFIISI